jgi:hypothetical protein
LAIKKGIRLCPGEIGGVRSAVDFILEGLADLDYPGLNENLAGRFAGQKVAFESHATFKRHKEL